MFFVHLLLCVSLEEVLEKVIIAEDEINKMKIIEFLKILNISSWNLRQWFKYSKSMSER